MMDVFVFIYESRGMKLVEIVLRKGEAGKRERTMEGYKST
jgi:hypothetical protein